MNFDQLFEPRLELIRRENRYRVFADLERCAGNFPQAFSHVALINTACNLSQSQGPAKDRQKS